MSFAFFWLSKLSRHKIIFKRNPMFHIGSINMTLGVPIPEPATTIRYS